MYRYSKEWSDVKEVPQDDSVAIVSIRYSDECKIKKKKKVCFEVQFQSIETSQMSKSIITFVL